MNNLVSFFFFTTYSFRSTWYFCCSSIRFLIYSNWFTSLCPPARPSPSTTTSITRSTSFYLLSAGIKMYTAAPTNCCVTLRMRRILAHVTESEGKVKYSFLHMVRGLVED